MQDFDKPSSDLQNKISEYILKSGFPFEWEVREQILKANTKLPNYEIWLDYHRTYVDPEEGKLREYDLCWFLVSPHGSRPYIFWNYYFECKQSEKYSWVFFTESPTVSWHANSINLEFLQILPEIYSDPTKVFGTPIFYGRSPNWAYSHLTFPEGSSDQVRTAIYQAVKPSYAEFAHYLVDQEHERNEYIDDINLYFPVVVFSGYMFEFQHSKSGGNLLPTKHVVLEFETDFSSRKRSETLLVDIVRADYLPNFLNNQIEDITRISNYLAKEQPELKRLSMDDVNDRRRIAK